MNILRSVSSLALSVALLLGGLLSLVATIALLVVQAVLLLALVVSPWSAETLGVDAGSLAELLSVAVAFAGTVYTFQMLGKISAAASAIAERAAASKRAARRA